MQPKDAWLTVGEAAALAGVSADTLKRWEKAGRIASARTPTNHRRFRRLDVEALLQPSEPQAARKTVAAS